MSQGPVVAKAKKLVKRVAKKAAVKKAPYITGYKAVNKDLTSIHDTNFKYVVGKEAVVARPSAKGICGAGIHFSRTMDYPLEFAGYDEDSADDFAEDHEMLELRVDPADIIEESMEKARASKVFVTGVVKLAITDYAPVLKRLGKLQGRLGNMFCQTPEKRLRDLFTNFTRRNKLTGYSLKLVTRPYEAQWLADQLSRSFEPGPKNVECPRTSVQDMIHDVTSDLDGLFDCSNGCDQIQECVSWILHSLACNVQSNGTELKVDALVEMLEAGALPLGYSTANKSKTVYWFVPSTTRTKWFPNV